MTIREETIKRIEARLDDVKYWTEEFKERDKDGVLRRDLVLFENQCKVFLDQLFILCLNTHSPPKRDNVCQTTAPSTTTS